MNTHHYHYPTRRAKAYTALLEHPYGISSREIDIKYFINKGNNEVAELERLHSVKIIKEKRYNQAHNGFYNVYRLPDVEEALKVIKLLNIERMKCGELTLSEAETQNYLKHFWGANEK